ncbi:MAG: symmetrical bis(5'-nucleosyl)-tetraphosphatase [Pseudomonadota bacterium]|nr:symmetrical bis(5'-nucleosyl)-tetraphosphatase [Pseudomonadota bacterium]
MATYAIGDVQGCYNELRHLLDQLGFDPARDRLWLVGDLVNRGPDSLRVLRFIKGLADRALVVLGNHDLHLLALAAGNSKHGKKSNLDEVLAAPDRDELLHWLRHRPLMHHDAKKGFSLIHAGLPPQWDLFEALAHARELETVLQGPDYQEYLHAMYGNEPNRWSEGLAGMDRLRFITNCFTRLRYCDADGNLALKEKGPPGTQAASYMPWFEVPARRTRDERIIFGHWSSLGYWSDGNVWALDSGCLWGKRLTAIRVRKTKPVAPLWVDCAGLTVPVGG